MMINDRQRRVIVDALLHESETTLAIAVGIIPDGRFSWLSSDLAVKHRRSLEDAAGHAQRLAVAIREAAAIEIHDQRPLAPSEATPEQLAKIRDEVIGIVAPPTSSVVCACADVELMRPVYEAAMGIGADAGDVIERGGNEAAALFFGLMREISRARDIERRKP